MNRPRSGATADHSLGDRYGVEDGTVLLSGIQALVRILLDRHRADRRAGLRTATFVSGYQGSPLGGYDLALHRERALLDAHDVHFTPGVNEELAATAVWGSQQESLGALAGRDGVVGVWYAKAPGVDRCGDVFRHANLMGVHPRGGVVVLAGDDPASKSSTIPSASELALADAQLPVLSPGNVQEVLDLGFHAIALSRFSGLWVGMKLVTDVADGFGTAAVATDRVVPVLPAVEVDGAPWSYRQGGLALPPRNLVDERDLAAGRLAAARAYGSANRLNEVTHGGGATPRLGIVAGGKTYHDVVQALHDLGIDGDAAEHLGVRVLRLGMLWPLDRDVVRSFADGVDEILVLEEKRPFVEQQVRDLLYDAAARPRVVGKRDERGLALVPADGELTADRITPVLAARLGDAAVAVRERVAVLADAPTSRPRPAVTRAPFFCSGCPHNRSTNVPEGSVAGGGIGCHTMAAMIGRSAVAMTQMGGEGAEWIGRAPFTDRPHVFQNLGDGTFFHSGSMAVRACAAAGVNITFKLLYNGAVAMTGGQDAAGAMPVPELTRALEAEGVRRTIVCAEDPSAYPRGARWAPNATVWNRDRLDEAQRALRDEPGVTVLVYDQGCAAEKRRHRKRSELATPTQRVFINERVCEGCGDCGAKSNCLSVQSFETEFGRKRRIHQSSCNLDFTCLEGDCPSFVTVHETRRSRRRRDARLREAAGGQSRPAPVVGGGELEEPDLPRVDGAYALHLTGVGGTGVVTMSQVLATAALLDGFHVAGLDQTGLSQKAGPVVSHLKFATTPVAGSNAVGTGGADAYLAFDLLVAAEPRNLAVVGTGTRAVVSTSAVPTGSMVQDADASFPAIEGLVAAVDERTLRPAVRLDAQHLAEELFGDHMLANSLLLGAAYQAGALPVSADSIERALALNGVAVARNQQAFRWGRRSVVEPEATAPAVSGNGSVAVPVSLGPTNGRHRVRPRAQATADALPAGIPPELPRETRRLLTVRVPELVDYQSSRVARRYLDTVLAVAAAEHRVAPGRGDLSASVARNLFTLTAYKDEYEVARLLLLPEFEASLRATFPDGGKVRYRLHPPILRALGMRRKVALGRWFRPLLRLLRSMRRVRGTPLDPFGQARVRRTERALVREYRDLVSSALEGLTLDSYEHAVEIADLPELVRGYESIKLTAAERFAEEARRLRAPAV
ncbi:MAG TPA: indolepyruvate ferredoxin oxidoreductase family protein [Acidimicrobiia bacterium]